MALKGLQWVERSDFNSWTFEDKDENELGLVRESNRFSVYDLHGNFVDSFSSLSQAKDKLEEVIGDQLKNKWRPK